MFWNNDHRGKKTLFESGTAENSLGMFYDNANCDRCVDDCCILLEGENSPILLEGFLNDSNCIQLEGCTTSLMNDYFIAVSTLQT